MRFLQVAHGFGTVRQNISQKGLTLGGSSLSGLSRPFEGGLEIRIGWRVGGKEAVCPSAAVRSITVREFNEAVDAKRTEHQLSFEGAMRRRSLQPTSAFYAAGRHASSFEIGLRDTVLGVDDSRFRCAGEEGECLYRLPLFAQTDRASQRGRRGAKANHPIKESHEPSTLIVRFAARRRSALRPRSRAVRGMRDYCGLFGTCRDGGCSASR